VHIPDTMISPAASPPDDTPSSGSRSSLRPGMVPAWMLAANDGPESTIDHRPTTNDQNPCLRRSSFVVRRWSFRPRFSQTGFLEKTLSGLAEGTRETVFAEKWARREGLLQRLDPRVKVAALLGFVIVTSVLHRLPALLGLYSLLIALSALSRLPFGLLLKRVWLSVPLFVGAVTLPAALNVVTPGRPLLVLLARPLIAITEPGLAHAAILTLRVGVAVSCVVLLTLTTPWNDLLRGLRVLFVPRLFLTVLTMTYRYLAVLMQATTEMFTARKSRTVGRTSAAEKRRFLGGSMGALFGKTLGLTDEIHAAMLSRGWTGETRTLRPLRLRAADLVWLGAMALVAVLAIGGEYLG